jgi:hypothetical protein
MASTELVTNPTTSRTRAISYTRVELIQSVNIQLNSRLHEAHRAGTQLANCQAQPL